MRIVARRCLPLLVACLTLAVACEPGEKAGDVVDLQLQLFQPAEPDPFGRGGSNFKVAALELLGSREGTLIFSGVVDFDQSAEGVTTLHLPEITGAQSELSFPIEGVTLALNGYNIGGGLIAQGVAQPVDLVLDQPVNASMLFTRLDTCSELGATLPQGRWGHTATLLGSGKILVFGGAAVLSRGEPDTALSAPLLFDPQTREVKALETAGLTKRVFHTATAIEGGVVIAGGLNDSGALVGEAVFFDDEQEAFTHEYNLIEARAAHAAVARVDGVVLAGGVVGETGAGLGSIPGLVQLPSANDLKATASVELLPPGGGTPIALDDLPGGARAFLAVGALDNANAVFAGGIGEAGVSDAVDWFPHDATAATLTPLGTARMGAATLASDGSVLLLGGTEGSGDPLSTGVLISAGGAPGDPPTVEATPAMDNPRSGFGIAALANGKVVALAGLAESQVQTRFASYAEVFDGEEFETTGTLRVPRGFGSVTELTDGRVVLIGGLAVDQDSGETEVLDSIELYVTARILP